MAEEPDNRLNHETLKKIQAGIADLRNAVADVRQDTRAITLCDTRRISDVM